MRRRPISSRDGQFTKVGLIYKTGGAATEAYYKKILRKTYYDMIPKEMAENVGAGVEKLEERIYIIKPLEEHFWAPFVEGRYDALSLLWRNIARDNVPNNCHYLAVISGVTDVMDIWDHRDGENDKVLPYIRLSDVLADAAEGKIRELREEGKTPTVFLAGTKSMTDHYSVLLDLFEQKGVVVKGVVVMNLSRRIVRSSQTLAQKSVMAIDISKHMVGSSRALAQRGITTTNISRRIIKSSRAPQPEQQLNNIIIACEQEGRLPNSKEQASIRRILISASKVVDIIALTCYELEACIDDNTLDIITRNKCQILYGATLHATELGKIVTSLLTT